MDNLNIQYIEGFAVQLVGYKIWAIDEFAIAQCYLIEGDTQAVLIDTGLGQGDLRSVVDRLTDKPYIIINTHGHSDHIGGNDEFSDHSIYMHMQDDCISHLENLSEEERLKSFKKSFNEPGFYGKKEYDMSRQYRKFTYSNVCEGQVFDLGGRTLEVIATPGHTRGSIVLFDKENRCLFSGDTVVSTPILIFNGLNSTTVEEYIKMQKEVPLQEDFLQYWENTEKAPVSILCSGFDAIIDTGLFQKKLDRLKTFIERILKKDPSVILYMESAFYMNSQVKTMFFESISGYGAVIGMNEEELTAQLECLGMEICNERPDEIISGLNLLLDRFSARGVVLHTKDYSVYYGAELKGIDIESGLTMGNLMSATRARIGHYGTRDECCKTLELELSERGLQMYDIFAKLPLRKFCCVVPTRYMEYPKYTIGLGDTFVAGVHTCFIQRTRA